MPTLFGTMLTTPAAAVAVKLVPAALIAFCTQIPTAVAVPPEQVMLLATVVAPIKMLVIL